LVGVLIEQLTSDRLRGELLCRANDEHDRGEQNDCEGSGVRAH
jgi:hypothetical protein